MSNDNPSPIQVEPRKMLPPSPMEMLILKDPEPNWVRTYSIQGWQRFPVGFILANSIPIEPSETKVLEFEMKAKGYKCIFCTIITKEKEIDDG